MIAAAAQIITDATKSTIRPHEPRAKCEDSEKVEMRRELADLRNQLNQEKKRSQQKFGAYQPRGRGSQRGGYVGYDREPMGHGGYFRQPRQYQQGPYQHGPPRDNRQADSGRTETGFYLKSADYDPDAEYFGRTLCRYALVISFPTEEQKFISPITSVISESDVEHQEVQDQVTTRSQTKKEMLDENINKDHVASTEGSEERILKKPRIVADISEQIEIETERFFKPD